MVAGREYLESLSKESKLLVTSPEFAPLLDSRDSLAHLRKEFVIPKARTVSKAVKGDSEDDCLYLCGNSLGLQPKRTRTLLTEELDVWAEKGVHGHFDHKLNRPWVSIDDNVIEESAKIVGAKSQEVAIMNSLTANLHFLMISFYRPTATRYKILMEAKAFPSDYFAFESQVKFHGYDPSTAIIQLAPRPNEHTLRTEDILARIKKEGDSIALILFSGVQYYTGQLFEMDKITKAGHEKGCVVGFDLAHAVGNAELKLHDWGVDFAAWCTYKYLNAGPGGIGGAFVHERHAKDLDRPRLAGWWGTAPETKFNMDLTFRPIPGAAGYRLSNPCVLATVALLGSLQVFSQTSMQELRAKSNLLTSYLEILLEDIVAQYHAKANGKLERDGVPFQIITPRDPTQRGCQLSVLLADSADMDRVLKAFEESGVVCDERKPNVIRLAPVPLYNTFQDVWKLATILGGVFLK